MARYPITIFLSAFLLFQVQPLVGKFILPWFGGSPAVWTTCMLFFQMLLLGGYSYAHLITSRLSPRAQTFCHLGLLVGSLVFLPIIPDANTWKPTGEEAPIGQILLLLAATIGLPYFLLSSTGPLLQEGFRRETGKTPYRLYSLSNVGSLLALLTYPFVFEPELALRTQLVGWSIGYTVFVLCCGACAFGLARVPRRLACSGDAGWASPAAAVGGAQPTGRDILIWLLLAACGSVMLLATTNELCQEITSVPFLWVLPLALYLVSFILCFDHERWYHRDLFRVLLVGAVAGIAYARLVDGLRLWEELAAYSTALWVCCMICHGELVRAKPAPEHATLFYLLVSAGGALGGILVAVVAPLALPDFWEYPIGLVATVALAFFAPKGAPRVAPTRDGKQWLLGGATGVAVTACITWAVFEYQSRPKSQQTNLDIARNFYGVLRVNEGQNVYDPKVGDPNGPYRELVHGRIQHGFQYLNPGMRRAATTYFTPRSGAGVAILNHPRRRHQDPAEQTLRIGIVGLGCGTLASYGKPGDVIRFYEINPKVIQIADEYFTYQKDSLAQVEVVLGDARIKLEQELAAKGPQEFDILIVDAFSSDAIPMHLLTRQCFEMFQKHLKSDGLLCMHISNKVLNLAGVARGLAQVLGYECVRILTKFDAKTRTNNSTWIILTANQEFLNSPAVADRITPWTDEDPPPLVWTDDYGSVWQVLSRW